MWNGFWICFFVLEVDVPVVLSLHEYILLRSVRGVRNMESWGSNILARLDPRPAGVLGGEGRGLMFQTQRYFCPPFLCFKAWSVALVAHRRELILVIQTDRPLSELVLWDYLTFLGSTVLWVTWQEIRRGNEVFVLCSYVSTGNSIPAALSLLFWNVFQMSTQTRVIKHSLNRSYRWESL